MKKNNLNEFLLDRARDLENNPNCSNRNASDCILSLKFEDGHIHHLLSSDENSKKEIIESLLSQEGIGVEKPVNFTPRPIIFRNRQAIGDILMMTCSIRDFHKTFPDCPINVATTAMHIWDNNPNINSSLTSNNAEVVEIGPGYLTNASNRDDRHFANAYRISIEEKLGVSIPQGPIKPDIWMTEEEVSTPIIEPPYWIIVAGEKGDWTAKTYPFDRWQTIVKELSHIKFVQIGAKEHKHPNLEGDNVINLIGKTQDKNTGIRDLFRLFYFAEGSMGLVSFQMHLAAAFNMPCIVIAGAREPARFTRYPGHQYLCTDGCLPCSSISACWHCDLEKTCPSIVDGPTGQRYPKCVDIITVEDVLRAFNQFYDGGRLSLSEPRKPSNPNRIVKAKKESGVIKIPMSKDKKESKEYKGITWGDTHITEKDWEFLEEVLAKYEIRTVLEFGPGLSTVLLSDKGRKITSFETDNIYLEKLIEDGVGEKAKLYKWDGKSEIENLGNFDLAIVDGPPGGQNREVSTKIASEHARVVLVHDAGRKYERIWQDRHLKNKFSGPGKGGNRWHLWIKEDQLPKVKSFSEMPKVTPPKNSDKIFRIFSNTRGDGGCGRSIDWFMKAFVNLGWRVEYVYNNPKPSGTYIRCGSPHVIATNNLDILRAPCDVFLLTSDDYVWEFKTDTVSEIFSNVNADRKVMYINYRIGDIGKIPWTAGWDKYLFLNSDLEKAFLDNLAKNNPTEAIGVITKVLPPPTDLSEYYKNNTDYSGNLRIVRHSSQGNSKYSPDFNNKLKRILEEIPDVSIRLMPPPSFIDKELVNNSSENGGVIIHKRNDPPINEFLSMGNVFWYNLPTGYTEGGPKVILEAMASGLPVITGNHSGPKDRVTKDTGFLCNSFEEELEALKKLNSSASTRESMGKAAREHAMQSFDPNNWITEIIGKIERNENE